MQPGFIFGENRAPTMWMQNVFRTLNWQDSILQTVGLGKVSEAMVPAKPVHVDKVAAAAL